MNLEDQAIGTVHSAITEAIKTKLSSGYNSPLDCLIKQAIDNNSAKISSMLLQDACARKLAKVIISKAEGEIEKQANELRSSPEFRAKLTIWLESSMDGTDVVTFAHYAVTYQDVETGEKTVDKVIRLA